MKTTNGTTTAAAVFAAFVQLNKEERQRFQAMAEGYEFRDARASNAGRKAAQTKRENAAPAVTA